MNDAASALEGSDIPHVQYKKPAAGGGAAGFSKITEQQLGGGVLLFPQTSVGGGVGRLQIEPTREEVHRFDSRIIQVLLAYQIDFAAAQSC